MKHFENISIFELDGEYWNPVIGYEGIYEYSNFGRIKSISKVLPCKGGQRKTKDRIRRQFLDRLGYLRIVLSKSGVNSSRQAHRVLMLSESGIEHSEMQVNHKNGIKTDNRICNLEWMTPSENQQHSYDVLKRKLPRPWLNKKGRDNASSKKVFCETNGITYDSMREAGEKLNINYKYISRICTGKGKSAHGMKFKYAV